MNLSIISFSPGIMSMTLRTFIGPKYPELLSLEYPHSPRFLSCRYPWIAQNVLIIVTWLQSSSASSKVFMPIPRRQRPQLRLHARLIWEGPKACICSMRPLSRRRWVCLTQERSWQVQHLTQPWLPLPSAASRLVGNHSTYSIKPLKSEFVTSDGNGKNTMVCAQNTSITL